MNDSDITIKLFYISVCWLAPGAAESKRDSVTESETRIERSIRKHVHVYGPFNGIVNGVTAFSSAQSRRFVSTILDSAKVIKRT